MLAVGFNGPGVAGYGGGDRQCPGSGSAFTGNVHSLVFCPGKGAVEISKVPRERPGMGPINTLGRLGNRNMLSLNDAADDRTDCVRNLAVFGE